MAGTIFASPSAEQVRRAVLTRVPTEKGVLVITMNYTGDVLNFGMAAEKAKAGGVKTEFFAIGDDVGVGRAKGGKVGRRGIGGGIMVLKCVGAASEMGCGLKEVYGLAQLVAGNMVSVGSSMEHVHVPGRGKMEGLMPVGDIEVGMGIHNEPGSQTVRADAQELIKIMLAQMLDEGDKDRRYVDIKKGDEVVLFVNNLGGVSMLEIGGMVAELVKQLKDSYGLTPVRVIAGTFLTSLNGLGFSASLLKLTDTGLGSGKSMLELLDYPAEAYGWAAPIPKETWDAKNDSTMDNAATSSELAAHKSNLSIDPEKAQKVLKAGLDKMIACEAEVTRYDTIVGDGDCGIGLKRGAEAVLKELASGNNPSDAIAFVNKVVPVVENTMDGTSGAIYAIFLNALSAGMREQDTGSEKKIDEKTWAAALTAAMKDLAKYTPAAEGDRTLMDSLIPFVKVLGEKGDVKAAAKASREGAEKTKAMKASLGRAVYVGGEEEWMNKVSPSDLFIVVKVLTLDRFPTQVRGVWLNSWMVWPMLAEMTEQNMSAHGQRHDEAECSIPAWSRLLEKSSITFRVLSEHPSFPLVPSVLATGAVPATAGTGLLQTRPDL